MGLSKRAKCFLECKHRNVQQFSECCNDCGENIYTTVAEIEKQEREEQERLNNNWNESGW